MFRIVGNKIMGNAKIMFLSFLLLSLAVLPLQTAFAQDPGCIFPSGSSNGEIYKICMPSVWNNDLVVFAHGYVSTGPEDIKILDYEITPGGPTVSQIANSMGYAFASTSYRDNGLVIPEAVEDVIGLVGEFKKSYPATSDVYLVGASEGGLVTALALEKSDIFDAGLALCGPVGNFRDQINYFGDFLVLFNYFFPEVWNNLKSGIPTPAGIPPALLYQWSAIHEEVHSAILAKPSATQQLLKVSKAAYDPNVPSSIEETILWNLWYGIFATDDAIDKLGGLPYDNSRRWYSGSRNDLRLNWRIDRYRAEPEALATIEEDFQTTGRLNNPLVTMHTTKDPIVPYWHETIYNLKTLFGGSSLKHLNIPVSRYGHCEFTLEELLTAFTIMRFMAWIY